MRRRSMVGLVAATALMISATASAASPVQKVQVDGYVALCNGGLLHISGMELEHFTVKTTSSGALLKIDFHSNSQGVSGVDTTTGTTYHLSTRTHDAALFPPPGSAVFNFALRYHLQATGGGQSVIVTLTEHLTITPNGTVTANASKFSASC